MPDIENNPDASRVIKGLRDTGYEFVTAAADVVDNSIEANAKNIKISLELERDGKKFVYIADDGDGMDKAGLLGAMKYGADERANPESLGKFGLGLKTASSAICLKFSVISRKSGAEPLNKLSWDLEYVKKVNKWVHPEDPLTTAEEKKFAEYCGEKGTLVIWSKCDRLLPTYYAEPGGTKEKAAIKRLANRLGEHCALTYHRFLDNKDKRANNVFIEIDGNPIEAWNPFLPDHAEQMLPDKKKKIVCELQDGSNAPAFMAAWILPHNDDLTDELKKKANIKNNRQGFYIFRYNRLIHSGDWLGMWINEPHHVLFRVEFDFGYELDDAFRVPVNKKGIEFDPELHKVIKSILQPIYLEARKRFDKVAKKQATRGIDHESSKVVQSKNISLA